MEDGRMISTWEKVLEYASSPLHGTLWRKLRKGLKLQINEGLIHKQAVISPGDDFIRVTESEDSENVNTYYNWVQINSIRTYSEKEEQ